MDSLALLCNLYGDGPATLRRLRDAGCQECDDIERLQLDELARVLEATREAALRFQSEARDLASRVARTEAEPPAAHGTPLRPDLLDGLDLAACVTLKEFGIESLEDLASVEPLELSRAMETGITRVVRLQFLARRQLESAQNASRPADTFNTIAPRPRASRSRLGERFSPSETAAAVGVPQLEADLGAWRGAQGVRPDEGTSGPFAESP